MLPKYSRLLEAEEGDHDKTDASDEGCHNQTDLVRPSRDTSNVIFNLRIIIEISILVGVILILVL
jgi:hypothetical protein